MGTPDKTGKNKLKMELKPEQINKFIELHKSLPGFEYLSEEQIREIANKVANYYLTLFKIHQRIKKDNENLGVIKW